MTTSFRDPDRDSDGTLFRYANEAGKVAPVPCVSFLVSCASVSVLFQYANEAFSFFRVRELLASLVTMEFPSPPLVADDVCVVGVWSLDGVGSDLGRDAKLVSREGSSATPPPFIVAVFVVIVFVVVERVSVELR